MRVQGAVVLAVGLLSPGSPAVVTPGSPSLSSCPVAGPAHRCLQGCLLPSGPPELALTPESHSSFLPQSLTHHRHLSSRLATQNFSDIAWLAVSSPGSLPILFPLPGTRLTIKCSCLPSLPKVW